MTLGGGKRRRSSRSKRPKSKRSRKPSKRRNSKSKRGKRRRKKKGGMQYANMAKVAAAGLTGTGAGALVTGVGAMALTKGLEKMNKNESMFNPEVTSLTPPMDLEQFTKIAKAHPILMLITAMFGIAATYAMYVKTSKEIPVANEILKPKEVKEVKVSYKGRNQDLDIHDWVRIREAYNNLHKKVSLLESIYLTR